ncbi:MAG: DNA primase [Leptolyngbyaceae cyanobacterium T60_A2020_046]|nr:DNA primase [Leptolyngbyaceae cyanobacterium T60_A2020_046]
MDTPRLHPDTISAVRDRADIVDIVSEHVVLKKQGKDFVGLCPFHDDKSPSFSVSPGKQFYYCFSCGAGGNAFKFLMELGKRSFSDVVLDLAKRYQVPVLTLEPNQRQELQRQLTLREQLYEILAVTTKFYEHALRQTDGAAALQYLTQQRGLVESTIQQFQLGYAPGGWQTLYGYLVEQKRYPVALVEQAGLIVPRNGGSGHYDRFRNRLMIPIHDGRGRVIAFGGRSLSDADKPKYLNSPDTELFDKGQTLFGLDKARAAIAKADRAVVVEGYFDVIALHAAGVTNSVAALGTALNAAQVRQLLRYTESKQVILNFDADAAGVKAAKRAIGEAEAMAYRGDVQLRVLNIPAGKDPDEFLKTHPVEEYVALLDAAPLWLDWQIQQTVAGRDLRQADQFQAASQAIVQLLSEIANADTRTHYVRHCAELFSHGDARLMPLLIENLMVQVRRRRRSPDTAPTRPTLTFTQTSNLEEAEAMLLRLYIHAAEQRAAIVEMLENRDLQFSYSHHRALWRDLQTWEKAAQTEVNLPPLVEWLRDRAAESLTLAQTQHLFYLDEKSQRDVLRGPLIIRAAAACIEKALCEKRYRHFLQLWSESDCTASPEQHTYYQHQICAEKRRIAELEKERQTTFEDLVKLPWVGEETRV